MSGIVGLGLGIGSGLIQMSQQKKAASIQQSAQNNDRMMAMMAAQQQNSMNAMYKQQQQADRQRMLDEAQKAKDTIPLGDGSLKGLNTIATSPLGDQTDPFLGRQKLLGG